MTKDLIQVCAFAIKGVVMKLFMQVQQVVAGGVLWVLKGLRYAITKDMAPASRVLIVPATVAISLLMSVLPAKAQTFVGSDSSTVAATRVVRQPVLEHMYFYPNIKTERSERLADFKEPIRMLKFNRDETLLAIVIGVKRNKVLMWDVTLEREVYRVTDLAENVRINSLFFTPDGCCFVIVDSNGVFQTRDVLTKKLVSKVSPFDASTSITVQMSDDGKWLLATAAGGGTQRLLVYPALTVAAVLPVIVGRVDTTFTPDSQRLLRVTSTTVLSYDIATAEQRQLFENDTKKNQKNQFYSLLEDDTVYIFGDSMIDNWNYEKKTKIWSMDLRRLLPNTGNIIQSTSAPIKSVAGNIIAVTTERDLLVLDLTAGVAIGTLPNDLGRFFYHAQFSNGGRHLYATDGNVLWFWSIVFR